MCSPTEEKGAKKSLSTSVQLTHYLYHDVACLPPDYSDIIVFDRKLVQFPHLKFL